MAKWSAVMISFLTIFLSSIEAQVPVFLVQPVSINAIEGSEVVFTCTANGSSLLSFLVDGDQATDPSVINKGFMQLSEPLDGGLRRANLTVTASSSLNNNSMIKCTAVGSSMNTDSDEVILRVQGPLSSIVVLYDSFVDSSTVNISWSPPFTLPGTDITGYNISATSNDITTNYFTSNSYYQLVSLCVRVNITISAFNGLDGESISVVSVDSSSLPLYVNGSITDDLHPVVSTNFTDTCDVGVTESISIIISPDDNSTQPMIFLLVPPKTDIEDYDTNITVSEDTNYTITVSYSIYDGDYTVNGSTTIDTYGVESLSYTNSTDGNITVTVYFNSFSTDRNCTVVVQNYTDIVASEVFTRTGDIAQGTISGIVTGIYTIYAYDEGSDVVAASLEFVSVLGLPEPDPMEPTNPGDDMTTGGGDSTSTPTTSTSSNDTSLTTPSSSFEPPILPTEGRFRTEYIIIIIVVIIIILVTIIVIILIIYWYHKKKRKGYTNENKRNSSDGLVGSSSFTDRSPTNPPPNIEDMYTKPDKTAHAPVVYAELSGFNKPHNNKIEPQSSTKRQDDRVEYSDLMIKGQPPPPPYEPTEIRETRLHSSATVIRPNHTMSKTTIVNHPDEDIQEIFFHHPNNDISDEGSPQPPPTGSSYPPAPTERAPSPPEGPNQPPPIPSRHHGGSQHGGNSRLPDVVSQHQNRQDYSEEGFNDESLNPTMGTLTEKQDGMFINTPAATYL